MGYLLMRVYAHEVGYVSAHLLVVMYGIWLVVLIAMLTGNTLWLMYTGFFVATGHSIALAWASLVLVKRFRPLLLSPLPLMFAFGAMHFGLGPWFHHFTEEGMLPTYSHRIFVDEASFFRVQVLNLVGFTFLFGGLWFAQAIASAHLTRRRRTPAMHPSQRVATLLHAFRFSSHSDQVLTRGWLLFVTIAIIMRGSDRLIGIDIAEALPGFLNVLERSGWVAVLLGGILAGRKGKIWWLLILIPLGIEVIESALRLRKSMILLPMVMTFIGIYLSGKSVRTLIVGALVIAALYFAIKPIVGAGRDEV